MESARAQKDSLTPSQQQAVEARGNVLVMAGAGTGKTHTLIARCLDCLSRERASLDEILVVTFTEAAATEMKQRLRAVLQETLNSQRPGAPSSAMAGEDGSTLNQHLAEQLALFDTAPIGTLHSFCLRLVREHFYELGLDPQLTVLDPGETRLLAEETMDEQFQSHYAGQTGLSVAAQNLIQIYGNGDERPIRATLLRLHQYAQTRPDADRWLAGQITRFASPEPAEWREWLRDAIAGWREEWLPVLEKLGAPASGVPSGNEKAAECLEILQKLPDDSSSKQAAVVLGEILVVDENYPARKKTAVREPLKDFFAAAAFLESLMPGKGRREPLAEDWDWVRGHMSALLQLTQQFGEKFAERKRADGVLDFHDLEQFALKLLRDSTTGKPTAVAESWRQKIRFVFVDEYQDINAAQDKIIQALSREERWGETTGEPSNMAGLESADGSRGRSPHQTNRFLVGDVKQSIYRFRLADPTIFRDYAKAWRGENGRTIPLTENFRSRESLLGFVNSFFELAMREDIGGVGYDTEARLQFGAPEQRATLGLAQNPSPRAELLLRFKGSGDSTPAEDDSGDGDWGELEEAEKEARLVARRLRELVGQGHQIWDEAKRTDSAVAWRDMAVLLRAPANKAEAYAKEFERAGVPLVVERGGFYDSTEIADLLSLLRLLDNPLQDIPAIAVLRSPLAGLSLDELATIRLAAKNVHFWTALNRAQHADHGAGKELRQKIGTFLERFSRWRQVSRQVSLSQCLETVLSETHYTDWLRSRPRGAQRQVNVEQFLGLAQRFDQFPRQGLFRFLKFIEAQQAAEAEPEVPTATEENAVRLMSIHQSKGLEFPVVVVADLAKPFNEQDLRGEIMFDEEFGICPRVKPPPTGRPYPSLPYWLAQRRQRREQRGEELRLLYVAMTRARDTLILTATVSENRWKSHWLKPEAITPQAVVAAKSYADWLGMWFRIQNMTGSAGIVPANPSTETAARRQDAAPPGGRKNELPLLRWRIEDVEASGKELETGDRKSETAIPALDDITAARLRAMLLWEYQFDAATRRAAKSSVTALRRRAEELDDEAELLFQTPSLLGERIPGKRRRPSRSSPPSAISHQPLSAAAVGTAHHKFLEYFSLDNAGHAKSLKTEANRLQREKILSADEVAALDLANITAFWASPVGRRILAQRKRVQRELPFTAKFSPAEVDTIIGEKTPPGLGDEFVVVQGVADLVVLLPEEIWLVDFKTDEIKPRELVERRRLYEPQLKLYVAAMSRIYSRPVTNCWLHFLAARKTVNI
ncbi:MAG TPA: UvrD-helicase domain-containing protein [Candidatus Acidoferrales bacterium]|nr:UvrD-helicase domain-containing protein [Candidatus Acidoferrales bacterium]